MSFFYDVTISMLNVKKNRLPDQGCGHDTHGNATFSHLISGEGLSNFNMTGFSG